MSVQDGEKDLIIPAIEGTKSILLAAAKVPSVTRIVLTSSFAAVFDASQGLRPGYTYTAGNWNPMSYDEAKQFKDIRAYRASKKYSELYAWDYIRDHKPHFDIATILPPVVMGPVAHTVTKTSEINISNAALWVIASGKEYPPLHIPIWVDVRDLAIAHIEALIRPEAGNRRFAVASPEAISHQLVADILRQELTWAKDVVKKGDEGAPVPPSFALDGTVAQEVLGLKYRSFRESVVDAVSQFKEIERGEDS